MGHLSRSCALSCDNLISADVVTAAGEIIRCDEANHPELFWAIRGGGGNFGVVSSFEFKAFPIESVFGGPTFFHLGPEVMHNYEALISEAPEQFNALFAFALAHLGIIQQPSAVAQ
jgi:FAD/FMN-containing dehydrogenase